MKVNFAHVCDYASISREGKLSAMGIFSQINVPSVPALHALLYLAFEIEIQSGEVGSKFKVEVKLATEDGTNIVTASADAEVGVPPTGVVFPIRVPQVVAIGPILFPLLGSYSFYVFVNGDAKATAAFKVAQMLPAAPQG